MKNKVRKVFKKKVSIILPTYNEKENIKDLIKGIVKHVKELHEIIVVDDNSPDGTHEIVRKISKKNKKIRLVRRINERGLASALARGIKESRGNIVGWMDADLGMPPRYLAKFLKWIPRYDIAIGSRYAKGGDDRRPFIRRITSRAINLFTNLLLGFSVKDFNSGFVVAKKDVFKKVNLMSEGYGQYCIRFLYECINKEYTIKETGYIFTDRTKGKSKTGDTLWPLLKHGWNYGTEVMKIRFGMQVSNTNWSFSSRSSFEVFHRNYC